MNKEHLRSEIEEKYKWNLEAMISGRSQFNDLMKQLSKEVDVLIEYKGKILKDSETLYNYLKQDEKVERLLIKLYTYAHMNNDSDSTNSENQKMKMEIDDLNDEIEEKLSFAKPEILKSTYEEVKKLIDQDSRLKEYEFDFEILFRYKKYTLSDVEETLISKILPALGNSNDIHYNLDNTDIDLGEIKDEDGNEIKLTTSNYNSLMESNNRNVRKDAFNGMYKYFAGLKNTFASNFRNRVKENIVFSKIRGYESPLTSSLYDDDVSVNLYKNLISKVHDNLDLMYDYLDLKKKALGLDEMHMYDVYVNIAKNSSKKIPFDEGKSMLFAALKPLGQEYLNDLNNAFTERWIDIYPNKGKKSGAYSFGCYDSYPYVLLNYMDNFESVSTTAHELGHSMHSYYSRKNQPYQYHDYPIILAEIASTVNEMLLNEYYYSITTDKNEKITLLNEFLENVRTTIYRQTMFAEFEMITHDKEQKGIPLTEKELSDTYFGLNKLYYGDVVVSDEYIRYEWARIPHFYSSFYVYKYATGLACAIAIVNRIINNEPGAKEAYLKFLRSGSSDYPLNILKEMNIDLNSGEVISQAIDYSREKLEKLRKLI